VQVLAGLFILWQIVFLVVGNLLDLANSARDSLPEDRDLAPVLRRVVPDWPSRSGHVHELAGLADKATTGWVQLTGQVQGWQLFTDLRKDCVFPAVLLRWDDDPLSPPALVRPLISLAASTPLDAAVLSAAARVPVPVAPLPPVTLLSENEPRDVTHYFRFGFARFRLRRFEGELAPLLRVDEEKKETPAKAGERWRGLILGFLNREAALVRGYLTRRGESYRREHPDRPAPKQLVLVTRRYDIVPPAQAPPYWPGPFTVPVARLRPSLEGEAGWPPLEAYNPVTQRFEVSPW
jgi:hypothetical protein